MSTEKQHGSDPDPYESTLEMLYRMLPDYQNIGPGAYKPGLERVEQFLGRLGNPQTSFCCIHVAGTNGKGSVSHMIASVLHSAGYRVGLYTSPHIRDFRERIRIDGVPVKKEAVVRFARRQELLMKELSLSFFEATVGMAFDIFSASDVEVAVIETGLGGRLDATNIINPIISIITNIGLDHTALLGETIPEIAAEKAGIIKKGVPVVIGQSTSKIRPVFEAKAAAVSAPLYFSENMYRCIESHKYGEGQVFDMERIGDGYRFRLETDMGGLYQRWNVETAVSALSVMNRETKLNISNRALLEGMSMAGRSTGLSGRWQVLGHKPLIVTDTGHNAHGLKEVVTQLKGSNYRKLYMILGFVADKDLSPVLALMPLDAEYIFTSPSNPRGLPADQLKAFAAKSGITGISVPTVTEAIAEAMEKAGPDDMIFIGGSNFVVADIPESFNGQENQQER